MTRAPEPGRRVVAALDSAGGVLLAGLLDGVDLLALEADALSTTSPRVGAVLRARAVGAVPGVKDAVLVETGCGQGFLRLGRGQRLRAGSRVLAQLDVPPRDGKRMALTTEIRLAGRCLVAMPGQSLAASRGIADRPAALDRAARLDLGAGWILRRGFVSAADEEIEAEAAHLAATVAQLDGAGEPGLVRDGPDALRRLRMDWGTGAEPVAVEAACLPHLVTQPAAVDCEGEAAASLIAAARAHLRPDIVLRSGGRLRVEPTAALTAVDIDAGRSGAAIANHEGLVALVSAMRVRNLGGLIVVDPVSPTDDARALLELLRRAAHDDPRQLDVAPRLTAFGLIELSRARRGLSLAEVYAAAAGREVAP